MLLEWADWIQFDSAYQQQVEEKCRLIAENREAVISLLPEAGEPVQEVLEFLKDHLVTYHGAVKTGDVLALPQKTPVKLDESDPFLTIAQLCQEDFCILQKKGDEHILTAALLGFPASWSLAEKIGRPMTTIHDPVSSYDGKIAKMVQRMFDHLQEDRPIWRANALRYTDPALFQPRVHEDRRREPVSGGYIRSERQSLLRLPKTQAIVFSIHTTVVPESALSNEQLVGLQNHFLDEV